MFHFFIFGLYPFLEYGFLFSLGTSGVLHLFTNPSTHIQINIYIIHKAKAPIDHHTEICNTKCKISNIMPGIEPSKFNKIFIIKQRKKFDCLLVLLIKPPNISILNSHHTIYCILLHTNSQYKEK